MFLFTFIKLCLRLFLQARIFHLKALLNAVSCASEGPKIVSISPPTATIASQKHFHITSTPTFYSPKPGQHRDGPIHAQFSRHLSC